MIKDSVEKARVYYDRCESVSINFEIKFTDHFFNSFEQVDCCFLEIVISCFACNIKSHNSGIGCLELVCKGVGTLIHQVNN